MHLVKTVSLYSYLIIGQSPYFTKVCLGIAQWPFCFRIPENSHTTVGSFASYAPIAYHTLSSSPYFAPCGDYFECLRRLTSRHFVRVCTERFNWYENTYPE